MIVRKPYYQSIVDYYFEIEHGPDTPNWSQDFISIHEQDTTGFSLMAPLALCRMQGSGRRPRFEGKRFPTHEAAKSYAERLIARLNVLEIHVVNCCESEVSA